MARTNHDRVGKALELLNKGLFPFIEREMKATHGDKWQEAAQQSGRDIPISKGKKPPHWDSQAILTVMWDQWNMVFKNTLGHTERSIVSELRDIRNRWAHQDTFSTDDAYRAIDNVTRLLTSVSAAEADEAEVLKQELLRVRFDEQAKKQTRKMAALPVSGTPPSGLLSWREVITPHPDVASGRYSQAEFAADLWQVYRNEGGDEYKHPAEFFRRTYLTEGLNHLLTGALERLSGKGGDPVVELQTNFGGGKTHSMLALYHLFSGAPSTDLSGVESIFNKTGIKILPKVNRVVIVGTRLQPGQPNKKPDGTVVRTMWGEIAWQLGKCRNEAKKAFEIVRKADETATNPGDALQELFSQYAPCLILIDEWVAYARQLTGDTSLPGGTFDAHFTFTQALTETIKSVPRALLVVSVPASDNEIGGERGKEALARLKNAIGRVHSPWRPASTEESFEIVRRRLFHAITEKEKFVARDTAIRSFMDMYRSQQQEFPSECKESDYERRMKAAYPIHPELFDRLFSDWSTLDKFQRTRGVLRMMAAVIYSLWERHDQGLLILPSSISMDDPHVQSELTRYLDDNWVPVIEKDVDGINSLPQQIDRDNPNLGRYSACRRVARTVFLGSAPTLHAANRGLEDRNVRLGCVQPGESVATFGDALRRIVDKATYLYLDGHRYWYSTQASVNRLAEDRAVQVREEHILDEIRNRVAKNCSDKGSFARIHPFPPTGADIPDEKNSRLIVLAPDCTHAAKVTDSSAMIKAKEMLEYRGSAPRSYRNTLVFLAPDKTRIADLELSIRQYLAWDSILDEAETLNLDPFQRKQAEAKRKTSDSTLESRIPESFVWLLVPTQNKPQGAIEWQEYRLQGQEGLAQRCSSRLVKTESLFPQLGPARLRLELDRIPLWRGNHIELSTMADYFAQYLYLPRLASTDVLADSVRDGIALAGWVQDSYAYAERYDEVKKRYVGLRAGERISVVMDSSAMIVKPEIARQQMATEQADAQAAKKSNGEAYISGEPSLEENKVESPDGKPSQKVLRRFHGSVDLDVNRVARDAGKIAEEIVQHMSGIVGAKVNISLEISADIPDGAPEHVVRTVSENCRTLKFKSHGFEED